MEFLDEILQHKSQNKTEYQREPNYNDNQNKLMREKRRSGRDIGVIPKCLNRSRRSKCKNNLGKFLKTYMKATFFLAWSNDHLIVLDKMQNSIMYGGLFALAMARGSGKTSLCGGAMIWGICNGWIRYAPIVGSDATSADDILKNIKIEFETNDKLLSDFPEICFPIRQLEGINARAHGQLCNGSLTSIIWTAKKIVFPTIEKSPASGSIIQSAGITGRIRGMQHKLKTGEIIRPDFVMIDDPQTEESAKSQSQCDAREKIIRAAILGLAGPGKKIAAVMPCTIIEKNDLAYRLLGKEHPEWLGTIMKLLYKLPDNIDLWEKYKTIWRKCNELEDIQYLKATQFYKENRKAMDIGAVVGWTKRKGKGELSALQNVFNTMLRVGDFVFHAEYQNDPQAARPALYDITPEIIKSRLNGYAKNEVPHNASTITCYGDINHIGINYQIVAWENDFTGYIINYGKYPEGQSVLFDPNNTHGLSEAQSIAATIQGFLKLIHEHNVYTRRGKRVFLKGIGIDGNYMTTTVCHKVEAMRGMYPVLVDRARGGKKYRPATKSKLVGVVRDNCHREYGNFGEQIVHNSDYWRMNFQKGFLLGPGNPGSISLYGDKAELHNRIAEEICGESLIDFVDGDVDTHYSWALTPGTRNDLLDAGVGSMVVANIAGCEFSGGEKSWSQRKKKKKKKKSQKIIN